MDEQFDSQLGWGMSRSFNIVKKSRMMDRQRTKERVDPVTTLHQYILMFIQTAVDWAPGGTN